MKAKITVNQEKKLGEIDRNLFGHFMEHAFGNIYGGVYDPGSPLADEDGFRTDVLELLRQVKVSVLRYPGGNLVSNYHWGGRRRLKENRPKRFDFAWETSESNQFGTAEFIKLCRKVGAQPLICVNMGDRNRRGSHALGGVLQRHPGHLLCQSAPLPWVRGALRCKILGPGQQKCTAPGKWEARPPRRYAGAAVQFAKAMKKGG